MKVVLAIIFISLALVGCKTFEIKDGGIAIGKDTVATMEEPGVAGVLNKF